MIRVGFVISISDNGWVGGLNYFVNLVSAMRDSTQLQPVLIIGQNAPESIISEFPKVETIKTRLVDKGGKLTFARKATEAIYGRAFLMERFLRANRIDVLSHSGHLGPRSKFPTMGWIPDFQHVRMPQFFSEADRKNRDRGFTRLAEFCTRVIVSSEDARGDLLAFRPSTAPKTRVLHFVPGFQESPADTAPDATLAERYGFDGPYFHLPNQFWVHKNHAVVIEALHLCRTQGHPLKVIATGNTRDFRRPEHFDELMRRAAELGVGDDFKSLGLIPFADLAALMRQSIALINPSFFEGWSTTVEESKSLGKTILLSDIPVHREQNPEFGHYFDPKSPEELAGLMVKVAESYSVDVELAQQAKARALLPQRVAAFAKTYEEIVLDLISQVR